LSTAFAVPSYSLVRKEPPLPPPSPLLLILSKGAQIGLLLVEVLQTHISTDIAVSPPNAKLTTNGGGIS